ncbi:hypothetical protein BJ165DRAFT_1316596, partial [Panaeolus papilionaceus]
VLLSLTSTVLLIIYVKWNDSRLANIPTAALCLSPHRATKRDVIELNERMRVRFQETENQEKGRNGNGKTGRRYIIVGGCGFLGGWIAAMLLDRGENPQNIRILDFKETIVNRVPRDAVSKGLQIIKVDITNKEVLKKAFLAPWSSHSSTDTLPALTVFHTAAVIRFYECSQWSYPRSAAVNVEGTANVIDASLEAGADVLIYTSSGNGGIKPGLHYLLDPRQDASPTSVQVLDDTIDEGNVIRGFGVPPKSSSIRRRVDFVSNYAVSKSSAERLVRAANKTPTKSPKLQGLLHTGCLRHGNCLFGPRGDMFGEAYLKRGHSPVFALNVIQSFTYVENAAEAHLCYEQRLIEVAESGNNHAVDISGQAFTVADSGPPTAYRDTFTVLDTLANGATSSTVLSLTSMLIVAYLVEIWYTVQQLLIIRLTSIARNKLLGELTLPATLIQLQPSLFNVTAIHIMVDDSRARLPPEQGGLGYVGKYTTLEGLWKT